MEQPTSIKRILPKANQIAKTADQLVRSIYPFEMTDPVRPTLEGPLSSLPSDCPFSKEHIVYDKFNREGPWNLFSIEKLKALRGNDFLLSKRKTAPFCSQGALEFDSRFESGNLSLAAQQGNEFNLLLHCDTNTTGYTSWFFFSVACRVEGQYLFRILNYGKAGRPYRNGLALCVRRNGEWTRTQCGARCHPNGSFLSLEFTYSFLEGEEVAFAYNEPYTYTRLLFTLDQIEERKLDYFHRKLAGTSVAGNRIDLLTVGNSSDKPVIVLLARTHPGETVSSWLLHHFLLHLLSPAG